MTYNDDEPVAEMDREWITQFMDAKEQQTMKMLLFFRDLFYIYISLYLLYCPGITSVVDWANSYLLTCCTCDVTLALLTPFVR